MKVLPLEYKLWFKINPRKKLIFPTCLVSSSNFCIQDCPACVLNSHQVHQPFNCFRGNYQLFNISHKQSMCKSYPLWNKAENTVMWLSWETVFAKGCLLFSFPLEAWSVSDCGMQEHFTASGIWCKPKPLWVQCILSIRRKPRRESIWTAVPQSWATEGQGWASSLWTISAAQTGRSLKDNWGMQGSSLFLWAPNGTPLSFS